jgi:signal transduction histidine kinase
MSAAPPLRACLMEVSQRFLALLQSQLDQFNDREDLHSLVVYLTETGGDSRPALVPVGQWPRGGRMLEPIGDHSPLREPAEQRRWLALRHQGILLGAIQVETRRLPWPASLADRLQATASCLTEALGLELERQQLHQALQQQQQQLRLLVHQLRNPLAALRTFSQLLLRRLEPGDRNRDLVKSLLQEERQLQRYVSALQHLELPESRPTLPAGTPLLLPPALRGSADQPLDRQLEPLLRRAAATATLQRRAWQAPDSLPRWHGDSHAVAEILANLLENAFAYSPAGTAVGLHVREGGGGLELTVWDGGAPIGADERASIFERGVRGRSGQVRPGTGLGLALARELAAGLGGSLELVVPPAAVAAGLPAEGNAFRLSLPPPQPPPPAP